MISKIQEDFMQNTLEVLQKDSRLMGLSVGGSYITKEEMDEYSDLDFVIYIKDENYEEVMNNRIELANSVGNLLSGFTGEHVGEPRLLVCLYEQEQLLHVDFKFVSMKDVNERVEDPVILWERDNCISESFKLEEAKFPHPDLQWIEDRFWVWVHYGATKIGCGELFETIEFISFLRQNVVGPLVLMKNNQLPKGVRKIEFDAIDSVDILKQTIPTYSKESCIKSMNILVNMYLELREEFITDKFIKREKAQIKSVEYLNNLNYK